MLHGSWGSRQPRCALIRINIHIYIHIHIRLNGELLGTLREKRQDTLVVMDNKHFIQTPHLCGEACNCVSDPLSESSPYPTFTIN